MKTLKTSFETQQSLFNKYVLNEDEISDSRKELEKLLKNRKYPDYIEMLNKMVKDPKARLLIERAAGGDLANISLDQTKEIITAKKLVPMQNEIDVKKSLLWGLQYTASIEAYFNEKMLNHTPIVTFNGQFVVDGHHRWSQFLCYNPNAKLAVVNYEGDITPIQMLKATQLAIAADIHNVPSSKVDGLNIFDASQESLKKYILENLKDECVKALGKYVKSVKDKESFADYVLDNLGALKANNEPIQHAPSRDDMPQTDKSKNALNSLEKGTVKL